MWRPGNLNIANCEANNPMNVQNAPPAQGNCWAAIAGGGTKYFFAWCSILGTGMDSNGIIRGRFAGFQGLGYNDHGRFRCLVSGPVL